MRKHYSYECLCALLFLCAGMSRCKAQDKNNLQEANVSVSNAMVFGLPGYWRMTPDPSTQISEYIRRVYQDKKGNIWLGTNGDGVACYNGRSLFYFTVEDGFGGRAVRGIIEDKAGNIWFGTDLGVTKYDGKSFVNFTKQDGLSDNDVWSILEDKNGMLWVGTRGGLCRYDLYKYSPGVKRFSPFPLPLSDVINPVSRFSAKLVWSIAEDKTGKIWLGTDGAGVYCYDGKSFTHFAEKDGLCNNNVGCILSDKRGNLWFGTRFAGVCRYDGKKFTTFSERDGLSNNFVWTMSEDKTGNIWLGTSGGGACRYDGNTFTTFAQKQGLPYSHVQSIVQDRAGIFWFGCSGGLYRYDGKVFVNITRKGPWLQE